MKQPLKHILAWCLTILLSTLTLPSSPVLADNSSSPTPDFPSHITISNPSPHPNDQFGYSIAKQGDLIVIGAPYQDVNNIDEGVVYLFHPSTGEMVPLTIPADQRQPNDRHVHFGYSVDIDGDYILVGTNNPYAASEDRAYLFNLDGELLTVFHLPMNPRTLGDVVALDADHNRALIAASYSSNGRTVELFNLFGVHLKTFRTEYPSGYGSSFGASLAIDGDRVLIGNPYYGRTAGNTGEVYLFDVNNEDEPIETLYLPILSPKAQFGESVSIDGNIALVGASRQYIGDTFYQGGAAFEFDAETGKFLTAYLRPYPGAEGFGYSVKVLGEAVLIGAPFAKKKEDDILVGAAFLFQAKNPGSFTDFTQPLASFTDFTQPLASFFNLIDEPECTWCFGSNVTLDSDGIVVANPYFDDPEVGGNVGEVYFYKDSTGALAELTQSRTNESIAVDIDSVNNVSNSDEFDVFKPFEGSTPVTVTLQPGTYTIKVISKSEGGKYDAWNRNNIKVEGCNQDGDDCTKGWEHRFFYEVGSEIKRVKGTGRHETVGRALFSRPQDRTLTLEETTDVDFYVSDQGNPSNNQGGVSLQITP